MKKIFNILFIFTLCFAFNSCLMEDEDIFGDSSANRMNKSIAENFKILQSAKNGWEMSYFSDPERNYGGYKVLVSFDENDSVKVASEFFAPDAYKESMYSIVQSAGPVLTFNTYNQVFHFFSDPTASVSGVGENGDGLEGDYEFLIMEADENHILLKGMKTENKILMTPLAEDISWESYLTNIDLMSTDISTLKYNLTVNNKDYDVSVASRNLFIETGPTKDEFQIAFVVTDKGIKLYEPITIDAVEMQNFTLSEDKKTLVSDDGKAVFAILDLPANESFKTTKSMWQVDFDMPKNEFNNMSEDFKNLLIQTDELQQMLSQPQGSRLLALSFGVNPAYPANDQSAPYSMSFIGFLPGRGNYYGITGYTLEISDNNEASFTNLVAGLNMGAFPAFYSFTSVMQKLSPFEVTCDDLRNPTYYRLESKVNPKIWFKIFKN